MRFIYLRPDSYAFRMRDFLECPHPHRRVTAMDFFYIALIAALTVATAGYLWLCDRVGDRK